MTAVARTARTGRKARRGRHGARPMRMVRVGVALALTGMAMAMPLLLPLLLPDTTTPATTADGTGPDTALLDKAKAYDRRLLSGGTDMVGETVDPFTTVDGQPAYETDTDYQNQLGRGDRMGTIRIPAISVDLPIGHGTSPHLLDTAAGHLYGTTLPTGDEGNSVLAAHRGLNTRLLFRRLGELRPGDLIWTSTAGADTAWKVTGTWKVDPGSRQEREAIAVTPGHSWLTLYTCDPPGLNTRRLIVRAERTDAPAPSGVDAWRADPWRMGVTIATLAAATVAVSAATVRALRRRHAHGRGRARRRHATTPPSPSTLTPLNPPRERNGT